MNEGRVVRIDSATGHLRRIATVPALDSCAGVVDPGGLAYFQGALFFLDAPNLYRVAVSRP